MCWMRVDLPEPVWPAMPKNSPGSTAKLTWRRAHGASGALPHWAFFAPERFFFFASPPS